MKFLTKQDFENLLAKLYMRKTNTNSSNQNKEILLSEKVERTILEMSQMIREICFSKNFNHGTYGISMTFFYYYICFNDLKSIDKVELAFACFFMSTKILFLNYKINKLTDDYKEYIKKKLNYEKKSEPDFIKYEIQLYSQLGYDLDIETPYHMYYYNLPNFLKKYPAFTQEKNMKIKFFLFNLIDDTYTRPLSLYYHPKIIYLSCLIFTVKFLEFNDINIEKIVEGENLDLIAECMENIYDIYAKYVENK